MRFTPQFLEELGAWLAVSEVVGKRVKLKLAGREWKGLSPCQQEKSPSFTVNDQKGFYHDFSSGKHGNIFDFVMETEGVSFPEAVERLAGMAGMALPVASPDAARQAFTVSSQVALSARLGNGVPAAFAGGSGPRTTAPVPATSPPAVIATTVASTARTRRPPAPSACTIYTLSPICPYSREPGPTT